MSDRKRVLVLGTSFAGYTAAIEAKKELGEGHDVVVLAPTSRFLFIPSLIWVPFGIREIEDVSFDVRPMYDKKGVEFIEGAATRIDLDEDTVRSTVGDLEYDYLIVATGPALDWDQIPGLGPDENSWSIVTPDDAMATREAFNRLVDDPGPVVVGAVQGAACFGAAYEFILNMRYQLKKHDVPAERAPLTFVTAEPFLSHFGIGGFGSGRYMCEKLFEHYDIDSRTSASIEEVTPNSVKLESGEELPSAFTMLIPRFQGVQAIKDSPGLANEAGFIETNDGYQHPLYPNVYAAGVAVHVPAPGETPVACGVPKTGYPSEQMAKTAVHNIVADITGEGEFDKLPFGEMKALCIMDAGNMGMMILGDHMLEPRKHQSVIPGPQAHWGKVAFEKHFLGSRRRGIV